MRKGAGERQLIRAMTMGSGMQVSGAQLVQKSERCQMPDFARDATSNTSIRDQPAKPAGGGGGGGRETGGRAWRKVGRKVDSCCCCCC